MNKNQIEKINTLGELKASGYRSISIKEEMRRNLIEKMQAKEDIFPGILGYEETVIPDIERAILSRHNMILLGLRGQAKTRIARQMTHLLDEYIPAIAGADLNDDPLLPLSRQALDIIKEHGDDTPIEWIHRADRYAEKLATPDVSVADLIGDLDPIKAANMKLSYSDERVIHFGIVPRSNRSIFVINELPDLQARIQVSLFNILQEGDVQIRGFKLRLPLDIQFVFTANPEDYTNRGSIVTPLKDRIESQILTHYPKSLAISKQITHQEAKVNDDGVVKVKVPEIAKDLIEQIAEEARKSEYVDEKSGVSARMTITAYENLISAAERRALLNGETATTIRVSDFWGVIPSITGKIELVYEGEQEGPFLVAQSLIGQAVRAQFVHYFPNPEDYKRNKVDKNPYQPIMDWFGSGHELDVLNDLTDEEFTKTLDKVPGLAKLVSSIKSKEDKTFLMEFALHGMAAFSLLSKNRLETKTTFKDLFSSVFNEDDGFNPENFN